MTASSKVTELEILACDAGWRNYHFVKATTVDGIIGWSEFDEGFGSPGVGAAIQRLASAEVGQLVCVESSGVPVAVITSGDIVGSLLEPTAAHAE